MSDFKSLNLNPLILNTIKMKGYTAPTPIQTKTIPHLLKENLFQGYKKVVMLGKSRIGYFSCFLKMK